MCDICGHSPCIRGCPNYPEKVVAHCHECGGEIYEGDKCFKVMGTRKVFCNDCILQVDSADVEELS